MLPSFPIAVMEVTGNFSHVASVDTVLSNSCSSSGKLSKLEVVFWRFAFVLIERSVVPVSIGIPIGISYLLSIEEGLRDGKALKLVLYPRGDKISIIKMRCKAHLRVDIHS
jgi:hypothetical protein